MAKKNHESDVNFIKELAILLKEHDLTELEVARDYGENDNLNVRVARQMHQNHSVAETRWKWIVWCCSQALPIRHCLDWHG